MNITEIVRQRYSTKSFDPSKKIAAEDFAHIEAALRNSPSSVNMQPWQFIIADDEAGKARIAKSTEKLPYNTPKITHASHVVVFAAAFAPTMIMSPPYWRKRTKTDVSPRKKPSRQAIPPAACSWASTATNSKMKSNGLPNKSISTWASPYSPLPQQASTPCRWKASICRF